MEYRVREAAWIAKIAAWKLRVPRVAIVFGRTIYLHGVSSTDFLANSCWLRHELTHIAQYRRYGFFNFLCRYLWECLKHGYYNNKYELEARAAEQDTTAA